MGDLPCGGIASAPANGAFLLKPHLYVIGAGLASAGERSYERAYTALRPKNSSGRQMANMGQKAVDRAELARLIRDTGIKMPQDVLEPLALYLEMLAGWNRAMNLVGFDAWQDIFVRLVADSFHLARFLDSLPLPDAPLTWDLGAGAGLPGIPLRMVWSRGDYHMVERREKRALFLSTALARLRLPRTHVCRGAVEDFFREQASCAHCILSRAFLPWRKLLDLTRAHLHEEGVLVILARAPEQEEPPAPWCCIAQHAYMADGKERWFRALCHGPAVCARGAGHGNG